jgi:glycolate oxidase FAD binding subunit
MATADRLLSALVNSATTPAAIELLAGPAWRQNEVLGLLTAGSTVRLAVGLEGTSDEVSWMVARLADEWRELGVTSSRAIHDDRATALWNDLAEFPRAPEAALVVKANLLPSRVTEFASLVHELDPEASIAAHAGNGIVVVRFETFDAADVSRVLIARLQPAAALAGGHAVVLGSTLGGLTRQAVWAGTADDTAWMEKVKRQFDPKGLLNPGRFVYSNA